MGTDPLWLRSIGAFFVPPLWVAHLLTRHRSYGTAYWVGLLFGCLWQILWAVAIVAAVFHWA